MAFTGRIRFITETKKRDLVEETEASADSPRGTVILDTDFDEVITLDVSPATDWAADDVVTGQTSGATCTVSAKLSATTYAVKDRVGTYTLGEIIGVTGTVAKLADQGATKPTFAAKDREGLITYTYNSISAESDGRDVTISAYTAPSETFAP
jgi:hypothetical protein